VKKASFAASLAFFAVCMTGCGTVRNLASDDPAVYGGVAKECESLCNGWSPGSSPYHMNQSGGGAQAVGMLLVVPALIIGVPVADISVNFVGDTLTMPIAMYLQRKRHGNDDKVYFYHDWLDPVELDQTAPKAGPDQPKPVAQDEETRLADAAVWNLMNPRKVFGKPVGDCLFDGRYDWTEVPAHRTQFQLWLDSRLDLEADVIGAPPTKASAHADALWLETLSSGNLLRCAEYQISN
jgi:hypothetical protein